MAAPSAVPSSDAAGWMNSRSTRPDAAIAPLALEFIPTPPAMHRFLRPVSCTALRASITIASSTAFCTDAARFLWSSNSLASGSRRGPKRARRRGSPRPLLCRAFLFTQ